MENHDRRYLLAGAGLLGVAALARTAQAGSLNPPGAPAPTGKTTQELYDAIGTIESRVAVQTLPGGGGAQYLISQPGSYYLAGDINVTGGIDGIAINASGVTLDLNGFALISTFGTFAAGNAIVLGAVENVVIRNGNISGATVVSGGGAYSGGGFNSGVYSTQALGSVLVENLNVSRIAFGGIQLKQNGASAVLAVRGCTVRVCGGIGIQADIVSDCIALSCGNTGISAVTASNCRGDALLSHGVVATVATGCIGSSNGGDGVNARTAVACIGTATTGYGINASDLATNCSGSASSTGSGVFATTAIGCTGTATGSGTGVYTVANASNCQGSSSSGVGINANQNADNCSGQTASGFAGLNVGANASNCSGANQGGSISNYAVNVGRTATNCYGTHSNGGIAVKGVILIGCTGTTSGGTTFQFTNKYNMP